MTQKYTVIHKSNPKFAKANPLFEFLIKQPFSKYQVDSITYTYLDENTVEYHFECSTQKNADIVKKRIKETA